MEMEGDDGSRLFEEARAGSRRAVSAVFERYGERLHALVRVRLGPFLRQKLESRDIVQATLLKAFRGFDRFHGSGSASMMAWLAAIAHDEICDQADFYNRKKRKAEHETGIREDVLEVAEQVRTEVSRLALVEETERLALALDELPAKYRDVIVLRRLEERSFREVGEELGMSPDAARMLLARAMTALTLKMRELG